MCDNFGSELMKEYDSSYIMRVYIVFETFL